MRNPFDPGIRIVGNSVTFAGCVCSNLTYANGPRGIDVEICVKSRRGGGKLVTARSPARSYRRAQQGKTEWGFGDITIRTSILEARRLTGDEDLAAELKRRFRADVLKGTGAEFVAAKLKERDERQERAGSSRYMVEPNVKEGKGGLRDLHTLMWIAEYLHPVDRPTDIFRLSYFNKREVRAFTRAFDFLHAVRAHLHFTTGRPEERLTFDVQPEIARRMGYGDRADNPAVERFMRHYFLIAREVGALTRAFSAKLEAEHVKQAPRGLSRFLPGGGKVVRTALCIE